MPLDINAFRNAVQNQTDGFIQLDATQNQVNTYATNALLRKLKFYSAPTSEQNLQVRQQLYNVLTASREFTTHALDEIRQALGISVTGQAQETSKLDIRTAKRVLEIVDNANANESAREALIAEAFPGGADPWGVRDECRDFIGLSNKEMASRGLQNNLRETLLSFKNELIANKRNEMFQRCNIPTKNQLLGSFDVAELMSTRKFSGAVKAKLIDEYVRVVYSDNATPSDISGLCSSINRAWIDKAMTGIADRLQGQLDEIFRHTGVDFSLLRDNLIKYVESKLVERFTSHGDDLVAHANGDAISQAMNDLVTQLLQDKSTMLAELEQAVQRGTISADAASCVKHEIATNVNFRKPGLLSAMLSSYDGVRGLLQGLVEHSGDLSAMLKAIDGYNGATGVVFAQQLRDKGIVLDPDASMQANKLLFRMAKVDVLREMGEIPNIKLESLTSSLRQLSSDQGLLEDILAQQGGIPGVTVGLPEDFQSQTAVRRDMLQAVSLLGNVLDVLMPENEIGLVPVAENFSEVTRDRLIAKGFTFRHDTPFTPISQPLSPKFQTELLADLNHRVELYGKKGVDGITKWAMGDFKRTGSSLTLNGKPFCFALNGNPKAPEALREFFQGDKAHGDAATKFILSFLGQGMSIAGRTCMGETQELFPYTPYSFYSGLQKYDLRRTEDGKYEIDAEIAFCVKDMLDAEGNSVTVNPAHSTIHQSFKLEISFDGENNPVMAFRETPTVRCDLRAAGYTEAEKEAFDGSPQMIEDKGVLSTKHYVYQQGYCDPGVWQAVRSGNLDQAFQRLNDLSYSKQESILLKRCGLDEARQRFLCSDILGNGKTLSAELVRKLLSKDSGVRRDGLAQFHELCQPYVEAGLLDPDFRLNLELLRIYDKPELVSNQAVESSKEDFSVLCDYVNRYPDDASCQALLEYLRGGQPLKGSDIQPLIAPVLTSARKSAGLESILTGQLKMPEGDAKLLADEYASGKNGELNAVVEQLFAHGISDADALQALQPFCPPLAVKKEHADFKAFADGAAKELKLSGESGELFKSLADTYYCQSRNRQGFNFQAFCYELKSPMSHVFRAIRYPEFMNVSTNFVSMREIFSVIDEIVATKTRAEWGGAMDNMGDKKKLAGLTLTYEKLVMQDLMHKKGGRLPTVAEVREAITAPGNWYDAVMELLYSSESAILPMANALPPSKREAFVQAAHIFGCGLNEIISHIDAIAESYQRGEMTAGKIWEICWREPLPAKYQANPRNAFVFECVKKLKSQVPSRYASAAALVMKGFSIDDACKMAKGEKGPYRPITPFASMNFIQCQPHKLFSFENEVSNDLDRLTDGYKILDPVTKKLKELPNIRKGSLFTFHVAGEEDWVVDTGQLLETLQGEDLANFRSGKSSSASSALISKVTAMCGAEHSEQILNVCLALMQGGMAPIRYRGELYDVVATEHSQAIYDIRKEGDNVVVHVTNPENCPLKFSWDCILGPNGEQTLVMGEFGRQILPETQALLTEFNIPKLSDLDATKYPSALLKKLEKLEASFYPTREEISSLALEINQTRLEMHQREIVGSAEAKFGELFAGIEVPGRELLIGNVLRLTQERLERFLTEESPCVNREEALRGVALEVVETILREKSEAFHLVVQHDPPIPAVAAEVLKNEILTTMTLNDCSQVTAILKSAQIMMPLMELLDTDEPVDKQAFLEAFHGVREGLLAVREQLKKSNPSLFRGALEAFVRQAMEYTLKSRLVEQGDQIQHTSSLRSAQLVELTLLAFQGVLDRGEALSDGDALLLDDEGKVLLQQELDDLREYIHLLGGLSVAQEPLDAAAIEILNQPESLVASKPMLNTVGIGCRGPLVFGQKIAKQASPSFQRFALKGLNGTAKSALASKKEGAAVFGQVMGDLMRIGTSLSLNGEIVLDDAFESDDSNHVPEHASAEKKILDFFAEDKQHGKEAGKIFGELANQGVAADLFINLNSTHELYDVGLRSTDGRHVFDIQRNQDGSYSMHCEGSYVLGSYNPPGQGGEGEELSGGKSRLHQEFTLRLSFAPDGTYQITYDAPPAFKVSLAQPSGMKMDGICYISLGKPGSNKVKEELQTEIIWFQKCGMELCDDHDLALVISHSGSAEPILQYLREHYISHADSLRLLSRGLSQEALRLVVNDYLGTGRHLSKEQVMKLLDGTREEQQAVKQELEALLKPYVERKWLAQMPEITMAA